MRILFTWKAHEEKNIQYPCYADFKEPSARAIL